MELKEKVKAGIGKAVTYWKQYGAEAALWADLIAVAVLYAMMTAHVPTQNGDNIEHIHSSFLIAQGQVPYRDFFQHHNPLMWYLLRWLICLHIMRRLRKWFV